MSVQNLTVYLRRGCYINVTYLESNKHNMYRKTRNPSKLYFIDEQSNTFRIHNLKCKLLYLTVERAILVEIETDNMYYPFLGSVKNYANCNLLERSLSACKSLQWWEAIICLFDVM